MRAGLILIAAALPMAACNKGPDVNVKNASVEEVAQKVRAAAGENALIQPGRWETKVTVLDMEIPGMPPQMADRMKQTMAKVDDATVTTCLTEADVKRPKEDFFAGKSKNCRYDHFTMSGGKIDAAMHCTSDNGGTMAMTINGNYSPDQYEATAEMNMAGGREGGMKMKSRTQSHRVGQCTGDEANARDQEKKG